MLIEKGRLITVCCEQRVKHFKDIQYTPTLTYGEMLLQNEYEMSCYNLDNADVASQQQLFELHQQVLSFHFQAHLHGVTFAPKEFWTLVLYVFSLVRLMKHYEMDQILIIVPLQLCNLPDCRQLCQLLRNIPQGTSRVSHADPSQHAKEHAASTNDMMRS